MIPSRPGRRVVVVATVLALVVGLLLPAPTVLGDARGATTTTSPGSTLLGPSDAPYGGDVGPPIPMGPDRSEREGVAPDVERLRPTGPEPTNPTAAAVRGDPAATRLDLVTGEAVVVREDGGELAVEAVSGRPVRVVTLSDRTYLLPEGVDLGTYDRSLFEVSALRSA
ncbi:MAG TPA: hypothetical protein VKA37_09510, partial [Halobacteriales archaeon]|nr:hypothetical protein [Halobacteriales archaeon]